jgi:hypothetical protein
MQTCDGSVISVINAAKRGPEMRHHAVEVVSKSGIDRKAPKASKYAYLELHL